MQKYCLSEWNLREMHLQVLFFIVFNMLFWKVSKGQTFRFTRQQNLFLNQNELCWVKSCAKGFRTSVNFWKLKRTDSVTCHEFTFYFPTLVAHILEPKSEQQALRGAHSSNSIPNISIILDFFRFVSSWWKIGKTL